MSGFQMYNMKNLHNKMRQQIKVAEFFIIMPGVKSRDFIGHFFRKPNISVKCTE